MEKFNFTFQNIWKNMDKIIASSTIVLVFMFGGFYFSTNTTLSQQSNQLTTLNTRINLIDERVLHSTIAPAVTEEQIKGLKDLILELKEHQQQSDLRQDKIYDILLEIKTGKSK
jgi:hypothetical protein